MNKNIFLKSVGVENFSKWFGEIISGSRLLNFEHGKGQYLQLKDAYLNYHWPTKKIEIPTPHGVRVIDRLASLNANEVLLNELSSNLIRAINQGSEDELAGWVEAILRWGGVYTLSNGTKGNAGWLNGYRSTGGLRDYLKSTISYLESTDDDAVGDLIADLRSNAGLTKIYSMACANFVIYDSRVAAALTWLLSKWSGEAELVPENLRFAAMRANTSKKAGKLRTANPKIFPYFSPSGSRSNHVKHLMWNIRANWVLEEALIQAQKNQGGAIGSMRALEASLFVLGDDLSFATRY